MPTSSPEPARYTKGMHRPAGFPLIHAVPITYAAGASLAAKAETATVLTVFAVQDPSVMTAQFEKSAAALKDCSTYTVELKGQKVTS